MFVSILIILVLCMGTCSSEGNIRLLEDEVMAAIQACKNEQVQGYRYFIRRFNRDTFKQNHQYPEVDRDTKNSNQYSHGRINTSETMNQNNTSTITKNDFLDANNQYGQTYIHTPSTHLDHFVRNTSKRINRSKQMNNKNDESNQVDKRGIPHEGKFWNKIEGTIKSQKSRALLEDQIRTCFQNLHTETDENICSYSNELERCLKLRFSDRINGNRQNQTQKEILS